MWMHLSNTTGIQNDFIITPSVPGWISTFEGRTQFYVPPTAELGENTNYSVTIPTTLQSTGGGGLSSPYSFSFSTGPFSSDNHIGDEWKCGCFQNVKFNHIHSER